MLISGYDKQTRCFFCSDYFGSHYETVEIPFMEINAAYEAKRGSGSIADYNYLWRYTDVDEAYTMNKQVLAKRLSDIICPLKFHSVDPVINKEAFLCTGVGMFDYLLKELHNGVIFYGDVRPFSAIREHMKILVEALGTCGMELSEELFQLARIAESLFLNSIKYSLSPNKQMIGIKMDGLIGELIDREHDYIFSVLCKI